MTPAGTHCPTKYHAVVDGYCHVVTTGDFSPVQFGIPLPWHHSTYFGDGSPVSETTTWDNEVWGSHKYLTAGEYTMSHFVVCSCPSAFTFDGTSMTFDVPGDNPCTPDCGADAENPPSVSIQSASIPRNRISVTLAGPGCTGDLEVRITGNQRTHNVMTVARAGPRTHTIDFGRDLIPEGQYDEVEATWSIRAGLTPDDEYPYPFSALGGYTHSQYTKPNQAHPTCATGDSSDVFVTEERSSNGRWVTNCFDDEDEYTATTFPETFRLEAKENGNGRSTAFGDIQLDWVCPYETPRPDAAAFGYVFRDINTIQPACTGGGLGSSTVAVSSLNPDLSCGDTIFVSGIGTKTVTDHCPICGTTKIDHYTADGRCSGILHLGTQRTFRLNR